MIVLCNKLGGFVGRGLKLACTWNLEVNCVIKRQLNIEGRMLTKYHSGR